MSQLRQDMMNAMQLRNFSENTQKSYITVIKQLGPLLQAFAGEHY